MLCAVVVVIQTPNPTPSPRLTVCLVYEGYPVKSDGKDEYQDNIDPLQTSCAFMESHSHEQCEGYCRKSHEVSPPCCLIDEGSCNAKNLKSFTLLFVADAIETENDGERVNQGSDAKVEHQPLDEEVVLFEQEDE